MKVKHLLIATILISLSVIDMYAAKYTVTITNDGGPGSLRDAVAAANATRDDDVIVFDISGCPNGVCTIVLTSGEIVVGDFWLFGRLTVLNPAGPQSLIISGNYASSVFYGFNSYLIINGLTVKHGPAGTWESAIECYGCSLVITRSEIVENAGIGVLATYSLLISNSTIANNNGRGVLLADASGWFENCTFTGNSGALNITESWAGFLNVTITDNSAQQGGGIFLESLYDGAGMSLRNSIISENTATDGPDIYNAYGLGSIDNLGNNIISEPALLGTLANNGGPTRTHALLAGSPAINAGNDCVLTENGCGDGNPALPLDQRGATRAGAVDIGAFEFNGAMPSELAPFDFDGDGRSDISVFRPGDGIWYLDRSTDGFAATPFGIATDKIVPADYDGDGKTDIAVYRDGVWWRIESSNSTVSATQFGQSGDIPVPADYTGDGRDDLAIFRDGEWWSYDLSNNQQSLMNFGQAGDRPVSGDYDGDGKADIAIFRPNDGSWWLMRSRDGIATSNFGLGTDRPVPGDYSGDGRTDIAVWRPDDGTWYVLRDDLSFYGVPFGATGDEPAPADFDGDGKYDVAVFRSGIWYINHSGGRVQNRHFGIAEDQPIANAYVP